MFLQKVKENERKYKMFKKVEEKEVLNYLIEMTKF